MPNKNNEHSEYEFQIQGKQLQALLKLADKNDQTLEAMITKALDQYIEREENNGR